MLEAEDKEKLTSSQIPDVRDYHKVKSIQKPYNTKTSQHSDTSTNSLYLSMSMKPLKRHDAPVSMKLPVRFSLPFSGETNRDTLQRTNWSFLHGRWIDNRCGNNINICRYKISPCKEAIIHLEIDKKGYWKTIKQYYMLLTTKTRLNINH